MAFLCHPYSRWWNPHNLKHGSHHAGGKKCGELRTNLMILTVTFPLTCHRPKSVRDDAQLQRKWGSTIVPCSPKEKNQKYQWIVISADPRDNKQTEFNTVFGGDLYINLLKDCSVIFFLYHITNWATRVNINFTVFWHLSQTSNPSIILGPFKVKFLPVSSLKVFNKKL